MIDFKRLDLRTDEDRKFLADYRACLASRKFSEEKLVQLETLANQRRGAITEFESARAAQNKLSQQVPAMKKAGQDATALLAELGKMSEQVKQLDLRATELDTKMREVALHLPNMLHSSVPRGEAESDNQVIKSFGQPSHSQAKEHWEIGTQLGLLDFDRAAKVTGSRFAFLRGGLARLERALGQWFLDLHTEKHGYQELVTPYMVNSASYVGTGQFPKFTEDVFHLTGTDYHLISTAEVPLTNFYREEILDASQLPAKFCALTPCFRSEAGAAGRDTKGLIRQHQFHKVELMIFSHPDQSYDLLESLTGHAETCLERLELPYRRVALCSADVGFSAAKTYDLEVWLPGQKSFREISSCSNFEDFQARRSNIRFRTGKDKPQFVHTLNGSGLAVGRTLIAILENFQNGDGHVRIPKVLQPYMGGVTEIPGTSAQAAE